jgi:hypothetical protein
LGCNTKVITEYLYFLLFVACGRVPFCLVDFINKLVV